MSKPKKLTPKEQKFVDAYDGNGVAAARKAGYKGNSNSLKVTASRLLTKVNVRSAIKSRQDKRSTKDIATREDRQAFWTTVMNEEYEKMTDRLKASELLGRSEADFVEKHQHTGKDGESLPTPTGPTIIVTVPANGREASTTTVSLEPSKK